MSSAEWLHEHGITYAKKCEECELQRECIAEYNERAYNQWSEEEEEDEELCDYTGEICIGNKLFCEECEVSYDDDEEEEQPSPDKERKCNEFCDGHLVCPETGKEECTKVMNWLVYSDGSQVPATVYCFGCGKTHNIKVVS